MDLSPVVAISKLDQSEINGRIRSSKRVSDSDLSFLRRRNDRSKFSKKQYVCPLCGLSLRGQVELKDHFKKELLVVEEIGQGDSLKKRAQKLRRLSGSIEDCSQAESILASDLGATEESVLKHSAKEIKQRKYMRYAKMLLLSSSVRCISRPLYTNLFAEPIFNDSASGYCLASCPVCSTFIENTENEGAVHIANCLAMKDGVTLDQLATAEEECEYEEYTFAGQTRLRTVTLLEDDLEALEGSTMRIERDECDDDLDVDGDGIFGAEQYCERDVIPLSRDEQEDSSGLQIIRSALTSRSCSTPLTRTERVSVSEENENPCSTTASCAKNDAKTIKSGSGTDTSEASDFNDNFRCFICMGPYQRPVISTVCWHVCCEECWLRALGSKKVCPKCNTIVAPANLRKVFL